MSDCPEAMSTVSRKYDGVLLVNFGSAAALIHLYNQIAATLMGSSPLSSAEPRDKIEVVGS